MAFLFSFDCPDQGSAKSRSGKLVCRGQRTLAKQSRISLACSAGCSQAAKWPPAEKLPACDPRIETSCDVLFANAVAKAPPIRPVPITTIFFTLLLLGLVALRRSIDQGDDLSGRAVAVQVVTCVLATSRRSIGARSGAL